MSGWTDRCDSRISSLNNVEMNVPKGKGKLNGQRDQRQPTANPSIATKPPHRSHSISVTKINFQDDRNCSGTGSRKTRANLRATGVIAAPRKRVSSVAEIAQRYPSCYEAGTSVGPSRTPSIDTKDIELAALSANTLPERRYELAVAATILILVAVRLVVAGLTPLSFDESLYWLWSQHIAGGIPF
jgi:hypothetical protein